MKPADIANGFMKKLMLEVFVVLAGCLSCRDIESPHTRPGFAAGYEDTIIVARAAGVDYSSVADRCLARDKEALHTMFWISLHAGFDAASSEGHGVILSALLRELGDDFFSAGLEREPADVQQCVRDYIVHDYGYDPPAVSELPSLKRKYPKTFPASYKPYSP